MLWGDEMKKTTTTTTTTKQGPGARGIQSIPLKQVSIEIDVILEFKIKCKKFYSSLLNIIFLFILISLLNNFNCKIYTINFNLVQLRIF